MENTITSHENTPAPPASNATFKRKKRSKLPLIILAILGIGAVAAGAAIWWANRPIQATILTASEKVTLDEKLAEMEQVQEDPTYTPGDKEIVLTEREINGLIHQNTPFGDQLKLELASNAVHARINADIPADSPIMAGKKLKGKARFFIKDAAGSPALILDDLTVWGISIPNAWLGDMKGQNMLGMILPGASGSGIAGVDDLQVKNRSLVIKLAD